MALPTRRAAQRGAANPRAAALSFESAVCCAQKIAAHREESDPERVALIIARSYADAAWVVRKYAKSA